MKHLMGVKCSFSVINKKSKKVPLRYTLNLPCRYNYRLPQYYENGLSYM